jgi:hypothetical protein
MNAFDRAWDLVKIGPAQDQDEFLSELISQGNPDAAKRLSEIGRIFSDDESDVFRNVAIEQMLDPSNQYWLTEAKTPTLYRAEPIRDLERFGIAPNRFKHGRFFSPQRLTAEQYAKYQGSKGRGLSGVHEYEMPVSFTDDSVLRVPTVMTRGGVDVEIPFERDSPEVRRIASMNDMSLDEAQKALDKWRGVYLGYVPTSRDQIRHQVGPLIDAGYNYVVWPEVASAASYPPVISSAFGSIDFGAGNEAKRNRREVEDWWAPALDVIRRYMDIPSGDAGGAMGRHHSFPQWAAWHIGDEDSAPRYVSNQGIPRNLGQKYQRVDYHNFNNAASIAESDLGLTGKRYDSR